MAQFTIYKGIDGLWHAKFSPEIVKVLGKMAQSIIQAQSEETATTLAKIFARSAQGRKPLKTVTIIKDEKVQESLF